MAVSLKAVSRRFPWIMTGAISVSLLLGKTAGSVNAALPTDLPQTGDLSQLAGLIQIIEQATAQATLKVSQLGIGGIRLEDREETVRQKFGKPRRLKVETNAAIGTIRTLIYPGITFELAEVTDKRFSVFGITTNSPRFSTVNGIRVGDPVATVLATYGQTPLLRESGKTWLRYPVKDTYTSLSFEVVGDSVQAIRCFSYLN